jgi:hypothetical protein
MARVAQDRLARLEHALADAKAHRGMAVTALRSLAKVTASAASSPLPTTSCASSP